jgi:hypothetical protein
VKEIEMQHDWQKELEALEVDPDIDRVVRIAVVLFTCIVCSTFVLGGVLIVRGLM